MSGWSDIAPWIVDALVLIGIGVMTIGVYGMIRMPDIYTRLHAASKAVFIGVLAIGLASLATGDAGIVARVLLIFALLLITTPVSSHVIGNAAYRLREPQAPADAIDESGRLDTSQ